MLHLLGDEIKIHFYSPKRLYSWFNTAAGIAFQLGTEQCKDRFSYHFYDEIKFNSFGSDRKHFVLRQTEERLTPKCIKNQ